MLIYEIDECFGCGGSIDECGHFLHGKVERRGDGYPKSRAMQCSFCGRPITDEEVQAAVTEHFERKFQKQLPIVLHRRVTAKNLRWIQEQVNRNSVLPGLPICYIQRWLGHVDVRSTLNYIGGINVAIRIWTRQLHHG